MNADRRKRLGDLQSTLETAKSDIEAIRDEEQEAYDNLPESLQQGERGQGMENAISELDDAMSSVSDAITSLNNAEGS